MSGRIPGPRREPTGRSSLSGYGWAGLKTRSPPRSILGTYRDYENGGLEGQWARRRGNSIIAAGQPKPGVTSLPALKERVQLGLPRIEATVRAWQSGSLDAP